MIERAAIILSAGLSTRMGKFKPLLPLGGSSVLSQCIELFLSCGVERVIVVTGKRRHDVAKVASAAGAETIHNADYEQGMFSSVLSGVSALPSGVSSFFVLPVDIPLVRRETVRNIITKYEENEPLVLYPRFMEERGHPPLINGDLLQAIKGHDGRGGLRALLERFDADSLDLDVPDYGVVHDIDFPEEYAVAQSLWANGYPSEVESSVLWRMQQGHPHIEKHCVAVSQVATRLCEALNERSQTEPLNVDLVRGAALTHDIGKGTKRHEAAGAELLHFHGFHTAADIVLEHFDMTLPDNAPITEKEVVFLADKLVRCQSPVPLENRYMEKVEMYSHEPGARDAILGRLKRAKDMMARFDREMGVPAEQLAVEALE
ncbi:DVU_1551 family NTP transferase [Pseudodesulfovibrio sp. zrk46]|uniref:DVU_1551 family NTP transferase n=1 Tax=Pseudodesulfovibrio sp. zrk46 TaxID=2725288 RepID=UPI001448E9C7|nr:NTP transferase domain-containing protein [Pseudodesulfovibrio sp. zrk46]QJB57425.1 NTP transferase domain-containing protein [Pseudodesulfovibrio sp. zrk46]